MKNRNRQSGYTGKKNDKKEEMTTFREEWAKLTESEKKEFIRKISVDAKSQPENSKTTFWDMTPFGCFF